MLTIIDQNGVFDFEVVFCACSVASNWWAVAPEWTVSCNFQIYQDNSECKTVAQQYYSKLQSTTNKMFPHLVPVYHINIHSHVGTDWDLQNMYRQLLQASCQWRDLKNRMEQGLRIQPEHSATDGAMALFYTACLQPGINLPDDWKVRYKP